MLRHRPQSVSLPGKRDTPRRKARSFQSLPISIPQVLIVDCPGKVNEGLCRRISGSSGRAGFYQPKENSMEQIANIERPGLLTRVFFRIGERMFGQIPTPERLMAHRLPLMLGLGGLYGAIEWFGKIDAQLRALLNVQVATLYGVLY